MKTGYCNAKVGVQAGVNFRFPDDNLRFLWPIDTKLGVWITFVKRQLTQVSVFMIKITVAKKRKSVSDQ